MKKIILIAAAALIGFSTPALAEDAFGKPEFERYKVSVTFVFYKSADDLQEAAIKYGYRPDPNVRWTMNAFSLNGVNNPTCEIHVLDPRFNRKGFNKLLGDLGHETLHCVFGDWHNSEEIIIDKK